MYKHPISRSTIQIDYCEDIGRSYIHDDYMRIIGYIGSYHKFMRIMIKNYSFACNYHLVKSYNIYSSYVSVMYLNSEHLKGASVIIQDEDISRASIISSNIKNLNDELTYSKLRNHNGLSFIEICTHDPDSLVNKVKDLGIRSYKMCNNYKSEVDSVLIYHKLHRDQYKLDHMNLVTIHNREYTQLLSEYNMELLFILRTLNFYIWWRGDQFRAEQSIRDIIYEEERIHRNVLRINRFMKFECEIVNGSDCAIHDNKLAVSIDRNRLSHNDIDMYGDALVYPKCSVELSMIIVSLISNKWIVAKLMSINDYIELIYGLLNMIIENGHYSATMVIAIIFEYWEPDHDILESFVRVTSPSHKITKAVNHYISNRGRFHDLPQGQSQKDSRKYRRKKDVIRSRHEKRQNKQS